MAEDVYTVETEDVYTVETVPSQYSIAASQDHITSKYITSNYIHTIAIHITTQHHSGNDCKQSWRGMPKLPSGTEWWHNVQGWCTTISPSGTNQMNEIWHR